METAFIWVFATLATLILVTFIVKLIALAAHALGLNPPVFLINTPLLGVPSRFYAGLFTALVLVALFIAAAMIFDMPLISDIPFWGRGGSDV